MKALFSKWFRRRDADHDAPDTGIRLPRQDIAERYTEEEPIARGGMSTVLRVRDRSLLRETALKRLDSDLAVRQEQILRFLLEASGHRTT